METALYKDNVYEPVSDAYDGKSIFVTGSSGFLGKVFVEKILYSCPKIAKVYVLMRDTAKASADEKLKKMLDCPLFKRLKDERPQDLKKIVPVIGDISKPKLEMNAEDENLLIENVSMVFHFAATVKFNEPLNTALNINVEGTRRILDLCVKIKNLQVFIYVSTAFSNGTKTVIDEVVYPPVMPLDNVEKLIKQQTYTTKQLDQILNGMPNTYTLSKNLAENMVAQLHKKLKFPMVIVRPSIVISSKDEPVRGWVDNWFGPTVLVVAIGKGIMRALYGDRNNTLDLIPVDYVSNVVIVAGARCRSVDKLEVFNSCSSAANPITLGQFTDIIRDEANKQKKNFLPLPKVLFIKWKWLMILLTFLLETVPVYIADCVLLVFGKKNIYFKMLGRVNVVRDSLEPFILVTWKMKSLNTSALAGTLSPHDKHVFACDAKFINWDEFIPIYLGGIKRYLLNSKKKSSVISWCGRIMTDG